MTLAAMAVGGLEMDVKYMLMEYPGDPADFPRPLPLFFNSHEDAFCAMLIQLSGNKKISREVLLSEAMHPSMRSANTYGILGSGAWDASAPNKDHWCGWSIYEMLLLPNNTIRFNTPNPYEFLARLWDHYYQGNGLEPYLSHEISDLGSVLIPWERQNTSVLIKFPGDVTRLPRPLPQSYILLEKAYDEMLRQVSETVEIGRSALETCTFLENFAGTDCGIYGNLAFFSGNDEKEPCDWAIYELITDSDGYLRSYWADSSRIEKYLEDKELSKRATKHE